MKRGLSILLIVIILLCAGCTTKNDCVDDLFINQDKYKTDHEKIIKFKEYTLKDNVSEIKVSKEKESYLFIVSKYEDFEYENHTFIFSKDEARHIILNELGFFTKYVVNMSEECSEDLELKLAYEKPEYLNGLIVDSAYTIDGYALLFEYVGEYNHYPVVYVNEFIYEKWFYSEDTFNKIARNIDITSRQDINNLSSLPKFYSNQDYKLEKEIIYFFLNGFIEGGYEMHTPPNKEGSISDMYINTNTYYIFSFKDGLIEYDKLSSFQKTIFNGIGFGTNTYVGYRTPIITRKIYKGFDENTTLNEFLRVFKEILLMSRYGIYIDAKKE